MPWFRRCLLLFSFALFWGGLTFYTGIVVRISHDVLNDPMDGGLITQRVTYWLQILGVITVALMFWDAYSVRGVNVKDGNRLVFFAVLLGGSLIGLFIVHGHLDAVIDIDAGEITDREEFTIGHRRYNQLTTVEWIASIAYLLKAVSAWRRLDLETEKEVP